nr:nucleotidyltransferase domain-containing protein [uncultured Rhodopila sp.]
MTRAIDLSADELAIVRDILRAHLPAGARVWVFGSRVTGTARRYSDLDLAVEADGPVGFGVLSDLAEALSESDLPCKVDVIDLRSVDAGFRTLIEPDFVELAFR